MAFHEVNVPENPLIARAGETDLKFQWVPDGNAIMMLFMAAKRETSDLIKAFESIMTPGNLPELGPGPRDGVEGVEALLGQVTEVLNGAGFDSEREKLLRSLVLLWHDHLDASHTLSQEVSSVDGSYVHGIMHRREPDYGNAKYWFRRVGTHECFASLACDVAELLGKAGKGEWRERLIPAGQWDSFAMVDLCESLEGRAAGDREVALAREVQAREFFVLLRHLCSQRSAAATDKAEF